MSIRLGNGRNGRGRYVAWVEAIERRELLSASVLQAAYWDSSSVGRIERPAIVQPKTTSALSSLKTATAAATPVRAASKDGFQIEVVFPDDTLTATQKAAFESAAHRWQRILTADIPDTTLDDGTPVDDLRIDATGPDIDGPGGILGQAGPDEIRIPTFLPKHGVMEFDQADLVSLQSSNQLVNVILHEMGHVLGFGTLWNFQSLLEGEGTADPEYVGAAAVAEYNAIFGNGDASVPIENTGGEGTRDSHWRESAFDRELMTGFLNGTVVPLSRVTAAQFIDLGYPGVDLNAADPFEVRNGNTAPVVAGLTDSPDPVAVGGTLTLTATGVTDGGTVNAVRFYRESNGLPGLQIFDPGGDELLETDTGADDGYTATISTDGLAPGTYTYYAQVEDDQHSLSVVRSTDNTISDATPAAAPTAVGLLAASDTGASDNDGLTRFNNSDGGQALSFSVSGTVDGATVTLFADGTSIGSATATGASTTVVTDGLFVLSDGPHAFTARQTAPGGQESSDSPQRSVVIDTAAPAVDGLAVSGSGWSAAFLAYLVAHHVDGPAGGFNIALEDSLATLPWVNIDQFSLSFTEPTTAAQASFSVKGIRSSNYPIATFTPSNDALAATWRITTLISQSDRLRIALAGVTDLAGNALDGEVNDAFPTGDGSAGGDFSLALNVLPGDTDQSGGAINASDLVNVRNRIGFTTANPGVGTTTYRPQTDINADGQINASDLVLVRNRIGVILPVNAGMRQSSTVIATPAASLFADSRIAPAPRKLVDALLA